MGADIIVFFTLGEDEEEPFPHRHSLPAFRAEELGCFKVIVLALGWSATLPHRFVLSALRPNCSLSLFTAV